MNGPAECAELAAGLYRSRAAQVNSLHIRPGQPGQPVAPFRAQLGLRF
jgi:hypothetical protein